MLDDWKCEKRLRSLGGGWDEACKIQIQTKGRSLGTALLLISIHTLLDTKEELEKAGFSDPYTPWMIKL